MNERALRQALLEGTHYQSPEPPDPKVLTRRILRRDSVRVWLLGYFCLMAWLGVSIGAFTIGMEMTHGLIPSLVAHLTRVQYKAYPLNKPSKQETQPQRIPIEKDKIFRLNKEQVLPQSDQLPNDTDAIIQTSNIIGKDYELLNRLMTESRYYFFWLIGGEAALLFLAAVLSIAYVAAGRKAMLRRVNATLLEISEQLKRNQSSEPARSS